MRDSARELYNTSNFGPSRPPGGTIVWKDSMVFASGGCLYAGTFGIKVSGSSAEVVWKNNAKCYEQSMLVVGDFCMESMSTIGRTTLAATPIGSVLLRS